MMQFLSFQKKYLIGLIVFMSLKSIAQQNPVAAAERAFARYAIDSSIKKAFLQFLDKEGVVFNKGEIRNGLTTWKAAEENGGKLLWQPAYTGISKSGDLGFSTGPFEYRVALEDTAVSSGQYTSIWTKNSRGEWKVLVDMGTGFTPSFYNREAVKFASGLKAAPRSFADWHMPEQLFIQQYQQKGSQAFTNFLTPASWFNLQGHTPLTTTGEIKAGLASIPDELTFIPEAGGIASSNDMAYVYGTVIYNGNRENFLRVWTYSKQGWKLVLQVLKW